MILNITLHRYTVASSNFRYVAKFQIILSMDGYKFLKKYLSMKRENIVLYRTTYTERNKKL